MKFSFIIVLMSFSMIMLLSCKKDLTKDPLDSISSGTFWKTEQDVQMALTGVYSRLRNGFFGYRRPWLDAYSDNAYDRFNYYNFQNLTVGIVNNSNVSGTFYNPPYQGIASCNYFLDNINQVTLPDARKNMYTGEVRFLRALFYFDLVTAYGGVIIYKTAPATVEASKIKQSTKEEVLAFITEDLDFAIANLADTKYEGHAVKGSAKALKTRVLLSQNKWTEAATLSKEIIDSKVFSLAPSYKGLFITSTQINSPEIMFSTDFMSPNLYHGDFAGSDVEIGWWGAMGAYANLGEDYEMKNGKMITDPASGYNPANPALNRDPRFDITLQVPGEKYINPNGTEFLHSDQPLTPYVMQKYVDLSRLPIGYEKANLTDQHIIHIRYADVLLMYAEAKNEVSGPDATIFAAVNEVRARPEVDMPPVDAAVNNSKDKMREVIRHERRIELALEGLRYFDLKRWGIAQQKLSAIKNPGGVTLTFGEKNNVLPFSQTELDRNKQLVQNQGY